jgi:microcystin-dependent protein
LEGAAPSIFVKSDGNVGIGTTGPTATLQVNGRIKDKTGFVLPAGTIVAFGGATTPEGWLMCDGTSYLQSTYPDLYLAIGKAFGGDGSNFNVPDFRGRFLRGVDFPATGRDPESGSRTFEASGGNTGNNVGSVQLDDFKSHVHTTTPTNFFNTAYAQIPGAYGAGSSGTQPTSATGGIETRPVNAYVNYIIKY